MKRINGRDCSLYIEQNGNRVLVPYKQETIRECLEGYSLKPCVGNLEKETYISLDTSVNGCFVTRLSKKFAMFFFEILSAPSLPYSLLVNRVIEKKKYTNLATKTFCVTGNNKDPIYAKLEIKSNKNTTVEESQELPTEKFLGRTYRFDGKSVFADGINYPLVYRFDMNGDFVEQKKLTLDLYMPMSDQNGDPFKPINKLEFYIDRNDGLKIEAENLVPINSMCDITAPDTNLLRRKYKILGDLRLIVKNEREQKEIAV